jgi:3-isopropylmalate/(R)-2-methylmalate dehydratase small subunit
VKAFSKKFCARGLPLPLPDIDTDRIVPARFLGRSRRDDLGEVCFYDFRRDASGQLEQSCALNMPRFSSGQILIAGANFGCGSSREMAVWALMASSPASGWPGVRAILAPSFGDIFSANARNNGLLLAGVSGHAIQELSETVFAVPELEITLDLETRTIAWSGHSEPVVCDDFTRRCLLEGLDDISLTLQHEHLIREHECQVRMSRLSTSPHR